MGLPSALPLLLPFLLGAVFAAGCASEGVPFHLRSRPEFAESDGTISVFGFFKDGRMTAETDAAPGPKPLAFLGNEACDVAYGPAWIGANPGLAKTVDDYTQANGITDDLLDSFAPAARGEMIMVITIAGHVATPEGAASSAPAPSTPPPSPSTSGRHGGGGRGHRGTSMPAGGHSSNVDRGALDLSASFFSVSLRRAVAIADTRYVGPSAEAAWKTFGAKLREAMPAATCRGWNWEIGVDAAKLRHGADPSAASSSPGG